MVLFIFLKFVDVLEVRQEKKSNEERKFDFLSICDDMRVILLSPFRSTTRCRHAEYRLDAEYSCGVGKICQRGIYLCLSWNALTWTEIVAIFLELRDTR
jgi:hypothetical protein